MHILVISNDVINVDNQEDARKLLESGARELSRQEIAAAGMTGYEHLVSPATTVVADDGSILFTPPEPPSEEELFAALRAARGERLAATDHALLPDSPLASERKVALTLYRQALRDLPAKEGAPWDGGGEATPWPVLPAHARREGAACA